MNVKACRLAQAEQRLVNIRHLEVHQKRTLRSLGVDFAYPLNESRYGLPASHLLLHAVDGLLRGCDADVLT